MAAESAVPPCGMMPTFTARPPAGRPVRPASAALAERRCRRKPPGPGGRFWPAASNRITASLAFSRRLGRTSWASMLREVSMATMMSRPCCWLPPRRNPIAAGPGPQACRPRRRPAGQAELLARAAKRRRSGWAAAGRWTNCTDQFLFDAPGPEEKCRQRRDRGQRQPKNLWLGESHLVKTFQGNFLQTVWPRIISSSNTRQPGHGAPGRTVHHNAGIF